MRAASDWTGSYWVFHAGYYSAWKKHLSLPQAVVEFAWHCAPQQSYQGVRIISISDGFEWRNESSSAGRAGLRESRRQACEHVRKCSRASTFAPPRHRSFFRLARFPSSEKSDLYVPPRIPPNRAIWLGVLVSVLFARNKGI